MEFCIPVWYTWRMNVTLTNKAIKQIRKLPKRIQESLAVWVTLIETDGIKAIRKIPGYNDEKLKGNRAGQRSSRLSKAYRVIYTEAGEIIEVQEVNKHDY